MLAGTQLLSERRLFDVLMTELATPRGPEPEIVVGYDERALVSIEFVKPEPPQDTARVPRLQTVEDFTTTTTLPYGAGPRSTSKSGSTRSDID